MTEAQKDVLNLITATSAWYERTRRSYRALNWRSRHVPRANICAFQSAPPKRVHRILNGAFPRRTLYRAGIGRSIGRVGPLLLRHENALLPLLVNRVAFVTTFLGGDLSEPAQRSL